MNFARSFHILILAALVLSGASPACEFIGGKSLIEICAADGTVKTIAVDAENTPETPQKPAKKPDCAFCFAQTHLKTAKAAVITITAAQITAAAPTQNFTPQPRPEHRNAQPRAPPAFSA